jgi:hypothetical protein
MPQYGEVFGFLGLVIVCVFSFVSIAVWVDGRRKEREAYYKSESMRRITEMPSERAAQAIAVLQEEERIRREREQASEFRKLEGMKLGGLINIAVGLGLGLMIYYTSENKGASLVGAIPGLIGVALLVYVYLFAHWQRQA